MSLWRNALHRLSFKRWLSDEMRRAQHHFCSSFTVRVVHGHVSLCIFPPLFHLTVIHHRLLRTRLRGALVCCTGPGRVGAGVQQFLTTHCPRTPASLLAVTEDALEDVAQWRQERSRRQRAARPPRPSQPSTPAPTVDPTPNPAPAAAAEPEPMDIPESVPLSQQTLSDMDSLYEPPPRGVDSVSEGQSSGLSRPTVSDARVRQLTTCFPAPSFRCEHGGLQRWCSLNVKQCSACHVHVDVHNR
jgi:hypothetical protein